MTPDVKDEVVVKAPDMGAVKLESDGPHIAAWGLESRYLPARPSIA